MKIAKVNGIHALIMAMRAHQPKPLVQQYGAGVDLCKIFAALPYFVSAATILSGAQHPSQFEAPP
jgi:hypothetical protein